MSERIKIGQAGDFPYKKLTHVNVGGYNILVYLSDDGFCAVENMCPHWNVPMQHGSVIEDEKGIQVQCPLHNSRFDMCTGQVTEWVRGAAGIKAPGFVRAGMAIGRKEAPIAAYAIEEESGNLYLVVSGE